MPIWVLGCGGRARSAAGCGRMLVGVAGGAAAEGDHGAVGLAG
jgi:hypothetical protein